jgi:pimeloyl-ACP methyl ester carboxylesterase
MSDVDTPDLTQAPEAILADLESRALRITSPCGDGEMVWRIWGSGPPLLILHGAHGSWAHWVRNIDALSKTRRLLAPDLPGYGESATPARPDDGASFAEAIADGLRGALGVTAPIDVAGFSLGGVIAGHLAAIAPDLVRRLILIDAGGLGLQSGPLKTQPVRMLKGEALRKTHRANLLALMLHAPESADDLAIFLQTRNVPMARVNPIGLVVPNRLLDVLPRVRAPIDAIWGEFDAPHPDPAANLAVLRQFQPVAEMRVIAGAGHWPMYERPEAFNAALLDLLSRPPRH